MRNSNLEQDAAKIVGQLTELLDEERIRREIDEPIDQVMQSFSYDSGEPLSHEFFRRTIGRLVQDIYRHGLRLRRDLSQMESVAAARRYGIPAYVERSKSKGFHVWTCFREENGVSAAKARLVTRHLLEEIEEPDTEVFPKQDTLNEKIPYGNFIYLPLFNICRSVFNEFAGQERNLFLEETGSMKPYADQWAFLESVQRIPESVLDEIIQVNDLGKPVVSVGPAEPPQTPSRPANQRPLSYGLPPCAQRMLNEGVRFNQRVACFRLAVPLKKAGLPCDIAVTALKAWALKNHPEDGKQLLTAREIVDQTAWAYAKPYRGCGCEDPAVARFCDTSCPLYMKRADGKRRANSEQ